MAKKSQINRDNRRRALVEKHAEKRTELRKRLNDPSVSIEEKLEVQKAFGISRIALRELALRGQLPGVRKSSW